MRIGYACISMVLSKEGISSSHTARVATIEERGHDYLETLTLQNISSLEKIILYNESIGIRFFRITSELAPHYCNEKVFKIIHADLSFAAADLGRVGSLARSLGHRLTAHPGQFSHLSSMRDSVIKNATCDLGLHAQIFRLMGYTPQNGAVMVIHGGGVYGDRAAAAARIKKNFLGLKEEVRQYIVFENDEFSWGINDLLPICEELSIPLVIDFFHHSVMFPKNYAEIFTSDVLDRIANIWRRRGIVQKVHVSSQKQGARRGTHDEYINTDEILFDKILQVCIKYNADIMLECKMKDLCAIAILEKYYDKVRYDDGRIHWLLKKN